MVATGTGRTCCCGCGSVRPATQFIAVISIVGSIYQFGKAITGLSLLTRHESSGLYLLYGFNSFGGSSSPTRDLWIGLMVISLILSLGQICLSILLLVGVRQEDETKCLPWLWYNSALAGALILALTGLGVYIMTLDFGAGIMVMAFFSIVCLIFVYMVNVVRNFIRDLREAY